MSDIREKACSEARELCRDELAYIRAGCGYSANTERALRAALAALSLLPPAPECVHEWNWHTGAPRPVCIKCGIEAPAPEAPREERCCDNCANQYSPCWNCNAGPTEPNPNNWTAAHPIPAPSIQQGEMINVMELVRSWARNPRAIISPGLRRLIESDPDPAPSEEEPEELDVIERYIENGAPKKVGTELIALRDKIAALRAQLAEAKAEVIDWPQYARDAHDRAEAAETKLGLAEISLGHKTTLLESCEKALTETQAQLAASEERVRGLREALEYAVKQVPELGTVPGISAALAQGKPQNGKVEG